jgi:thiamine-phosphate pyrophosphorylase
MKFQFPKVYPILDSSVIPTEGREAFLRRIGTSLADAGVTLFEYRNKTGSDAEVLADTAILRSTMPEPSIKLILDDRVHLVEKAGFNGVHVDAGDLAPAEARKVLGGHRIVGTFGGSETLVPGVLDQPADYFSIGPIGLTTTKQTSKSPIGPEGVRRLRAAAGPHIVLVAAGGVTLESARQILAAGATTVAVAAAIFRTPDPALVFRSWIEVLGSFSGSN